MRLRNIAVFNLLGSALLLFSTGCKKEEGHKEEVCRNVILINASTSGETVSKSFSGVVEEGKTVNAAFMTGGKISSLNVKEGDRVKKGQLLASLDNTDYLIGVNQLKVQLEQMTAEKKRMDEMFARHNVAPNDYEKFQAGYRQLQLQLEMAHNKLGYTKLYSPSNGFISYQYMQPGELVDAGTPVYKITDDSRLEVAVDLPLAIYLNRKEIRNAYGSVPNVSGPIPLTIDSFTPDADNNQLYHMKLGIPGSLSKELTPGMNMTVVIDMANETSNDTKIPSRAIFDDNGKKFVWVYNPADSTINKKQVEVVGAPSGGENLVAGIDGTEQIVATGVKQLKDGEKVNVVSSPVKPE